jgi:hypothetical protein
MYYVSDLTLLDAGLQLSPQRRATFFSVLDQLTRSFPPADFLRYPKSLATPARHLYPGDQGAQLFAAYADRDGFSEPAFAQMREVMSRCPDAIDEFSPEPGLHVPVLAQAMRGDAILVSDEVENLADRVSVATACGVLGLQTITSAGFFRAFSI